MACLLATCETCEITAVEWSSLHWLEVIILVVVLKMYIPGGGALIRECLLKGGDGENGAQNPTTFSSGGVATGIMGTPTNFEKVKAWQLDQL